MTLAHLRVYGAIARGVRRGKDFSWVGQRLVAKNTGFSQMTVSRRVKDLVSFGFIEVIPAKDGQRTCYRMLSNAFAPSKWNKSSSGKRSQSGVSSTVRRAKAWANTSQSARGSVLDEILGKESA